MVAEERGARRRRRRRDDTAAAATSTITLRAGAMDELAVEVRGASGAFYKVGLLISHTFKCSRCIFLLNTANFIDLTNGCVLKANLF